MKENYLPTPPPFFQKKPLLSQMNGFCWCGRAIGEHGNMVEEAKELGCTVRGEDLQRILFAEHTVAQQRAAATQGYA